MSIKRGRFNLRVRFLQELLEVSMWSIPISHYNCLRNFLLTSQLWADSDFGLFKAHRSISRRTLDVKSVAKVIFRIHNLLSLVLCLLENFFCSFNCSLELRTRVKRLDYTDVKNFCRCFFDCFLLDILVLCQGH
jgi:hypothetical protein